ncbi:MAG: hypothetical protein QGI83_10565 [Candidatus Latescibacteria bacterium]|jgi:hypothetical protein|nr:hypothetical protein [Candidatus Latescibacterota bacterium]
MNEPILWRATDVPDAFCTVERVGGRTLTYGGDIRMGDLRNSAEADFLVYRSVHNAHDEGGMKPCFLGAFTAEGQPIWSAGGGGTQPSRPGPVAIHDLDGDGQTEVVCFFHDARVDAPATSMADVVIQVRDGATGHVKHEAAPARFRSLQGQGANWAHQRILVANLRGLPTPQDFVVKIGAHLLALDSSLNILWEYECPWTEYGHCPAYIPAVGDIDGDGKDEVNGGYFLIDHDGAVLWQKDLAPHMDSVAIAPWDDDRMRAICSGHGHVVDERGNVVMKLGGERVPHGQEVRVGRFRRGDSSPQMVIRWNAHSTEILVVDVKGVPLAEVDLNPSPNNTGMEVVDWDGEGAPAVLYNGGMLWDPLRGIGTPLPGLPAPQGVGRMDWYHCIPADVCGDAREEVILYNPWTTRVYLYTQSDNDMSVSAGFSPGPRQVNPRLMD